MNSVFVIKCDLLKTVWMFHAVRKYQVFELPLSSTQCSSQLDDINTAVMSQDYETDDGKLFQSCTRMKKSMSYVSRYACTSTYILTHFITATGWKQLLCSRVAAMLKMLGNYEITTE